jgi:orotidine-5'-phosphate decarboxylase
MSTPLLYVGLDLPERAANLSLADRLTEVESPHFGFKINLDHALLWGEAYIRDVVALRHPVFVDLKMNNGPRTMTAIVAWLGALGVAHTNVWAHADGNLARTVSQLAAVVDRPALLAVTFYTRWDQSYAQRHHHRSLEDLVAHWARSAVTSGADGIILPAPMLPAVSDLATTRLTPGIRLPGQRTLSEQTHVATPQQAIADGADMLVVSSPIYGDPAPADALRLYLTAMLAT